MEFILVLGRHVLRGSLWLPDGLRAQLRGLRPVPPAGGADERRHRPGLLCPGAGVRGEVLLGHDRYCIWPRHSLQGSTFPYLAPDSTL